MKRRWAWIVMNDGKPVRRYDDGKHYIGSYAETFDSWTEANRVKASFIANFSDWANKAAADEDEQRAYMWLGKIKQVRIVRVAIDRAPSSEVPA